MEEVPWQVSLIVSWLPFLFWIIATIWAVRRIGGPLKTPDGRPLALVIDDYGRELKRANDMLEQLLTDHRKRLEALEQRG
jgi:hypothetical protein